MKRLVLVLALATCSPAATPKPLGVETSEVPAYDRSQWGSWVDADKDCQDTRQEVLVAESEVQVTFVDPAKPCRVATGRWTCPYTGQVYTNPSDLDIDHAVPLWEAHYSGGYAWDSAKKRAYFNDLAPEHLMAVSSSANRSKGNKSPQDWLPSNVAFRCTYLRAWIDVKRRWGLEVDCPEAEPLTSLFAAHCR